MKTLLTAAGLIAMVSSFGCASTSKEEQRRSLVHQQNSVTAAENGQFGIAGDEQKKAHEAHAKAVKKAIDEGKPIPPQPKPGDPVPADPAVK
jgi:hypothetical protein